MAKRYTHPAQDERYYIKARPEAGDSQAEIARSLGRSASTVSRELKRNTGLRGYRPQQAQRLGDYRHADSRRGVRLTEAVRSHIVEKLKEDWSPEQISGRMRLEGGARVSPETIHRFVWSDKRCGKNDFKGPDPRQGGHLKSVRTSSTRAPASERRDGDTVVGAEHRGHLVTLSRAGPGCSSRRPSPAGPRPRPRRPCAASPRDSRASPAPSPTTTGASSPATPPSPGPPAATPTSRTPATAGSGGSTSTGAACSASTSPSPCRSTASRTSRSGGPSPGSTTGRASASASKPPSKSCKTPTIPAKSLFHRALHFKVECRWEIVAIFMKAHSLSLNFSDVCAV